MQLSVRWERGVPAQLPAEVAGLAQLTKLCLQGSRMMAPVWQQHLAAMPELALLDPAINTIAGG